nr:hypothetical protein JKL49_18850 [Phenylobacterium glaciei]
MFCYLREANAGDQAKLSMLEDEEYALNDEISSYFDPDLWQVGGMDARKKLRDSLRTMKARAPVMSDAAVAAAIPELNFDRVTKLDAQLSVKVSENLQAGVCATAVKASIRQVNPTILSGLQQVRGVVIEWLGRSDVRARRTAWDFASAQMGTAIISSQAPTAVMPLTPAVVSCLEKAAATAKEEAPAKPKAADKPVASVADAPKPDAPKVDTPAADAEAPAKPPGAA